MINELMLLVALSCPAPIIIVPEGEVASWRDFDTILEAAKGCSSHYEKSPCVIKYERKPNGHVQITCGAKR